MKKSDNLLGSTRTVPVLPLNSLKDKGYTDSTRGGGNRIGRMIFESN